MRAMIGDEEFLGESLKEKCRVVFNCIETEKI